MILVIVITIGVIGILAAVGVIATILDTSPTEDEDSRGGHDF